MNKTFSTITPIDGTVYCEREYAEDHQIERTLASTAQAQKAWKQTSIAERAEICRKVVTYFETHAQEISEEITWQMGRPILYAPFEIKKGLKERALHMIELAETELQDLEVAPMEGFRRFIRKEPLGTVLVLSPWNYPYLTAINAVIPAIMAGNTVILKHAEQTPLRAERFASAFEYAAAPEGVFHYLHLAHGQPPALLPDTRPDSLALTDLAGGSTPTQDAEP